MNQQNTQFHEIPPRYPSRMPMNKDFTTKYTNDSGINVSITGTPNDVARVIEILHNTPPNKYPFIPPNPPQLPHDENIKEVSVTPKGHINVSINDNVYSGSGILILVNNRNDTQAFFSPKAILFHSKNNNTYEELGGRIDKPSFIDADILFDTAKREAKEESIELFNIMLPSTIFVDIESQKDRSLYRVYVYMITVNKLDDLKIFFNKNMKSLYDRKPNDKGEYLIKYDSYRETSNVTFFDLRKSLEKINTHFSSSQVPKGIIQNIEGDQLWVRGRTLNILSELSKNYQSYVYNIRNYKPIRNADISEGNYITITIG
jgi:hypothetical protein